MSSDSHDFTTDSDVTGRFLLAGTKVGEFLIEHAIGKGGMGTVYLAKNPQLGNLVAIKILEEGQNESSVSRFKQEAMMLAKLHHPNIVSIYSFGILPDGRNYYVMEYLEGITLRKLLKKRPVLSLAETVPIIVGAGTALHAAHRKGIVHRDVKASNIFLLKREEHEPIRVKLFDFGIGKLLEPDQSASHATESRQILGSPQNMSPEQCRGEPVDQRSDIYSLGLVAYLMLAGKPAIEGETLGQLLLAQQTVRPPLLSTVRRDLPPELSLVIEKAIAKEKEDRYATMEEFIQQFVMVTRDASGSAQMEIPPSDFKIAAPSTIEPPTISHRRDDKTFDSKSLKVKYSTIDQPRSRISGTAVLIGGLSFVVTAIAFVVVLSWNDQQANGTLKSDTETASATINHVRDSDAAIVEDLSRAANADAAAVVSPSTETPPVPNSASNTAPTASIPSASPETTTRTSKENRSSVGRSSASDADETTTPSTKKKKLVRDGLMEF